MPNQRGITLVFACVTALSCGTNYAYSSWAPQLAAQLGLSSTQTNLVGVAGNVGVYLSGPIVGLVVDRKGLRPPLLFGALALTFGYALIRIIYNGGEQGLFETWGVGGLAVGQVLVGSGSSSALAAAGNGVAKSFGPKRRGGAIATVVACFGLSAFFYSTISHASLFAGDNATSTFLLVLCVGCGGSTLLGLFFIKPALYSTVSEYRSINSEDTRNLNPTLAALEVPILTPEADLARELGDDMEEMDPEHHSAHHHSIKTDAFDISGWHLLRHRDFWLLWTIIGLLSGVGLMFINNVGTVARTLSPLDADPREVATAQAHLVSLLSIFNCLGRLTSGFVSDYALHHAPSGFRFARVWWLVPISALFVVSQALAGWTVQVEGWNGLARPTVVTGFAYGSMFGLLPVLCIEWFGLPSFSTNSGWVTIAPAVFGNTANMLFGKIYDSNVAPSSSPLLPLPPLLFRRGGATAIDRLCLLGPECFSTAFHMTTGMSVLAVGLSVYAGLRKGREWK